ncbi:hypothetical protein SAMN04488057_103183 [Cyclobacterium lianum]|uniref:Uncharacterized protein n=1 Tax=Cyclobacterium lianum TaxID=388280 RepID=A0A1M7L9E4_9BACT|nr:hypothetical protein [Cyclobacterium lianum]SHM74681.1 hypothetical protein SAMN04488057_103183 [Cyclobacterium lianum]
MQEKWILRCKETLHKRKLHEEIPLIIEENKKELAIFLSLYTKSEGAIAENVKVLDWKKSSSILNGSLRLGFDKVFYNACINIHETEQEQMDVNYVANAPTTEIILTGPYIPERDPDEI